MSERYRTFDDLALGSLETMAAVCETCGSVVINVRAHDAWHEQLRNELPQKLDDLRRQGRL